MGQEETKKGGLVRIPEIRFTITEKLDKLISESADELGVSKADYIRSLILTDLSMRNRKERGRKE